MGGTGTLARSKSPQERHGVSLPRTTSHFDSRQKVAQAKPVLPELPELTRRRGQASLSLLSVKSSDSSCTVRVASAFPETSGLFESYRAALLAPALVLESATGTRLSPSNVTQIQEDPTGIVIESRFEAPQSTGARLHARVPTAISTQKIPFRFQQATLTDTPSP